MGAVDPLFGTTFGFLGFRLIQIVCANGGIGQHGHGFGLYFQHAAGDVQHLFATILLDQADQARLDGSQQRSMTVAETQLTFGA